MLYVCFYMKVIIVGEWFWFDECFDLVSCGVGWLMLMLLLVGDVWLSWVGWYVLFVVVFLMVLLSELILNMEVVELVL